MNREEARRERDRAANPAPHDVPGFNRATGVDDPVPDAEYGDVQGGPDRPDPREQDGSPDEGDEVDHAASIRDRAEQLHDDVHESDRFDDTKFDCWGVRAILRLAELETDRPAEDAPDHEHDAYAHERATTMASIASELLSAVAHSDVVADVETGRLLAGKSTTHELVADHQQAAHWVREEARRDR